MILPWVFGIMVFVYCLLILFLWIGWEQVEVMKNDDFMPSVGVIVPVRNESNGIGLLIKCLQSQTYRGKWHVFIVNDHSEDDTVQLANERIEDDDRFTIIHLKENEGKKQALALGIETSSAEIILTTDGDCQMKPEWIEWMVGSFQENVQMVSGPVGFVETKGLFQKMQIIEFASLIGSGAAMIGWHKPIMANGANLAFRKSAYEHLGGYKVNENMASGDDVFLLHGINHTYEDAIVFAKEPHVLVQTTAQKSIKSFWQQRKRWASKWKNYSDIMTKLVAVLVFCISFGMALMPVLVLVKTFSVFTWLNLFAAKAFFDFFFLRQIVKFSESKMNIIAFLMLQLIYPYYVISTALFSLGKTYNWKGRTVK